MVKAAHADLSSTTPLFGISPTTEMGDSCHREVTLTLPLVVFILSKAPLDSKMVVENAGTTNGQKGQWHQGAMVLQTKSGNRRGTELPFGEAQKGVGGRKLQLEVRCCSK